MGELIEVRPDFKPELLSEVRKLSKDLDWGMERALDHRSWNPSRAEPPPVIPQALLHRIGSMMWEGSGLSDGEVGQAVQRAVSGESTLRIAVLGEHGLPWELLRHPDSSLAFLARHPWCALLSRTLDAAKESPARALPLRILLFVSSPGDLDPERSRLDYEREEELLFTALDRPLAQGKVDIDVAEDGRLSALMTRLSEDNWHALILSMHGTKAVNAAGKAEWGLLFEHESTGKSDPVAGGALVARLQELPAGRRPPLVLLAACRSAKAEEAAGPLAGSEDPLAQWTLRSCWTAPRAGP